MIDRRNFMLASAAGLAVGFALVSKARAAGATTWDSTSKASGITLSNNDLTATMTASSVEQVVRASSAITGKTIFEISYHFGLGNSNTDQFAVGITNSSLASNGRIGASSDSAGFRPNSATMSNGFQGWDSPRWDLTPLTDITVMIAVDPGAGKIWLYTGSAWIGDASGSDDPVTGTGGLGFSISGAIYPAVEFYDYGDIVTANFGASSFVHSTMAAALQGAGYTTLDSPYPPGVVAASLQSTYDLIATPPAPRVATTNVLGTNSLPTGVTDNGSVLTFDGTSQAIDFRGWDLGGAHRRIFKFVGTGAFPIVVRDNIIAAPSASVDYLFNVGMFQGSAYGAPDVTIEFNDIDCADQAIDGGLGVFYSGILNFSDNNARNFGAIGWNTTPLTSGSTATRVGYWERNYFGTMGVNARNGVPGDPAKYDNTNAHTGDSSTGAHCEYIHTLGAGEWHINDNVFDLFGWDGQSGGSFSSFVSIQSFQGTNTGEILRNIGRWNNGQSFSTTYAPRGVSSPLYFMSAPASSSWGATSYNMDIGGNVVQHGQWSTSTFIVEDEQSGTTGTLTVTSTNYDYDSGAQITV